MSTASQSMPRIFVSHNHTDNGYCREFVAALRQALGGAADTVWYDEHNLGWGNIRRTIEHELQHRQHFIAILSPAAVESQWVNDEIDAALGLFREGKMCTISFVTAKKCDVPLLLRGYKRVEADGGGGYLAAEAAARVLRFILPAPLSFAPSAMAAQANEVDAAEGSRPSPVAILSQRPAPAAGRPMPLVRAPIPEQLERVGFVAEWATDPDTGKQTPFIRPPLCYVSSGRFLMGSDPRGDIMADDDEQPQCEVMLTAYHIGMFPVTEAEYACFVASGHAAPDNKRVQRGYLDHPVVAVSWYDARDYAAWFSKLTGQLWQLPSEAEWEKAARWDAKGNGGHGVSRIYPWGDRFDSKRCNTQESHINQTTAVGTYGPANLSRDGSSPCGAQDMAGNVWEWTRTIYDAKAYSERTFREDDKSTEDRVMRGGSWAERPKLARAALRGFSIPDNAVGLSGFRLILVSAILNS